MIYAGILLAILLWFSLLGYMVQSPLWHSIGSAQAESAPSEPLINPKYLASGNNDQPVTESRAQPSTRARLGWSLLIGLAWSTGFWLLSGYLDERYRLEPLRFGDPGRSIREGFLFSTGSLFVAAMIVNLTQRAIRRRHRAHE